jgi:hypothetical protein
MILSPAWEQKLRPEKIDGREQLSLKSGISMLFKQVNVTRNCNSMANTPAFFRMLQDDKNPKSPMKLEN